MLVEDQLVESNPCDKIKMPREQARPQPYVSDVDYDGLLSSCDNGFMGRRDKVILTLLSSTGCRRCELVALTMGDVNLTNGTVLIRKSKSGSGRWSSARNLGPLAFLAPGQVDARSVTARCELRFAQAFST